MRLVGHKGADAIRTGNTIASFEAAVEAAVDMIELDVLWQRDGHPRLPAERRSPLVIAHDWEDASRRTPLTLGEALDAFTKPPLDRVEFDLDLKLRGREDEVVAALRERDLMERAMTSGMEASSVHRLRELAPELRRGWTFPKIKRDYRRSRLARPFLGGGLLALRRRAPAMAARGIDRLQPKAIWALHLVVTKRLVAVTRAAGVELIAWTVDDAERMRELAALGVDGICTNDPRLFAAVA
jgi:glycerophosphoryl diester phosphodiesterase